MCNRHNLKTTEKLIRNRPNQKINKSTNINNDVVKQSNGTNDTDDIHDVESKIEIEIGGN